MSMDMDSLLRKQAELQSRIAHTIENLKKSGAANITADSIDARLLRLDSNWTKFEAQHDKLTAEYWDVLQKHEYWINNYAEQVEETYVTQRAQLQAYRRSVAPLADPSSSKHLSGQSQPNHPRTTLPRIQLPHFSGRYEDWPCFRDLFSSLIGRDKSISDVEKLHFLKVSLKGEAEALVRNLPTTEENYGRAWKALTDFYENKRLLVRSYFSNFQSLQKLKSESAPELRKLYNCVTATVGALESIGRPITSSEDLFVFLVIELLDSRSRREWETSIGDTTEPPSYESLKKFLERRLHTVEAMQPMKPEASAGKQGESASKSARSHHARKQEAGRNRCSLCSKDHFVMLCDMYKAKPATERKKHVEENNLCFNCLGKHRVIDCTSKKACTVCGKRHHSSLHDAYPVSATESEASTKTAHVAQQPSDKKLTVLLATARVRVADRFGILHQARALIDQGSETSIVTEALAQRLRLPRHRASVAVFGVGGQQTGVAKGRVIMTISPLAGGPSIAVPSIVLPRLTVYAGTANIATKSWNHLRDLKLADPDFVSSDPIDILLGADIYSSILEVGLRKGGPREPIAQRTSFGWILSGAVNASTTVNCAHAHRCSIDEPLSALVRKFWEQEELPLSPTPMTREEQECEDLFVRTHLRQSDGRYVVRLPVKVSLPDLSSSKFAAARVLKCMEQRFTRNGPLQQLYTEFMSQYEDLQHMTQVKGADKDTVKRVCYLPHHGVLKEASTSTKLRVVFNGSLITTAGDSLNQNLLVGPNLLPTLADVLMRWRWHKYVVATDIEKMYRQILVHREDRDLQRILWRRKSEAPMAEYRLNTVTYGLACAPFLAIRSLRQLADDEQHRFPHGSAVLLRDVYVDDILTGASTIQETLEIQKQLIGICMAGGFPLKKWAANDTNLLLDIPEGDRAQLDSRSWSTQQSHPTLGIKWHPTEDAFSFAAKPAKSTTVTKRSVLSQTAQLFDPLGWLAPVVIRAKILIQTAWIKGIDWDTPFAEADSSSWRTFQQELQLLSQIRVPRWLHHGDQTSQLEVHGFADASERAFAAVIYLRAVGEVGVKTSLIAAKTKVAPVKQISLPRLELCAATILTRLTSHALVTLQLQNAPIHLWSDSTVVLGWIRGHPSRWQTFVANRVAEVQTTLPTAHWHHIPSQENPADCASRGLSPSDLVTHCLWWRGPARLVERTGLWAAPTDVDVEDDLPERRTQSHAGTVKQKAEEPQLLTRYSSLHRLMRITAWCRRWPGGHRAAHDLATKGSMLTAAEVDAAQQTWIRIVQAEDYKEEIRAIKDQQPIARKSKLKALSPILDEGGVVRVGGRIKHALLSYDERHPIILPSDSHLTGLIIDSCHRRTLHGGVQLTLGMIRQRFWIPRGRAAVKRHIHRCVQCVRWRAASPQQLMGDLPRPRVTPSRPFLHTGVDYAGPVMLRLAKGRGHRAHKAFIAVFVCLATKAVHLDVVSDYTAEAFIAAFRRFTSRRGLCQVLYSDCGTNFVGADKQLRALFTASGKEAHCIHDRLADDGVQWRFNPPAAPHFGGLWEAAVKSLKHHLRRVIGDHKLTYEEMSTLLAQIEACLNSRPLQALTDDPDDTAALTPGHFLIGSALNAIPEPSLAAAPSTRLSRWQHLQQMRDHFWDRWSQEYLHGLMQRQRWWKSNRAITIGRLCLIRTETTPPTKWPLARIVNLHPGEDGNTRVVTVRTAASEYTRPVAKLVLLPATTEKCNEPLSRE